MPYILAYISRSTVNNTPEILDDIAIKSSNNNSKLGVTGVLLLNGNYFFQVLEGREDIVKALYNKIEQDSRHSEAKIVLQCDNNESLFNEWFMRAFNLDDYYDVNMSKFRKSLNDTIGKEISSKNDVLSLIKSFRRLVIETNQYRKT